jgi:hypothetical protein
MIKLARSPLNSVVIKWCSGRAASIETVGTADWWPECGSGGALFGWSVFVVYADEARCEQVRALQSPLVCQLARVEVPTAIWRKQRMGELGAAFASILVADFEADYFGTHDQSARFCLARPQSSLAARAPGSATPSMIWQPLSRRDTL